MADTIIGEVRKNAREVIRVQATVYNHIDLLDCRVYADNAGGEAVPTRKGLSLRAEQWRELLPMLEGALAVAEGN